MAENIFAKFNEMFNTEDLKKDVAEANQSNLPKVKVPFGEYEVSVVKLEVGENTYEDSPTKGCPQINVWFKVLTGEFAGQRIFWSTNIAPGDQWAGLKLNRVNEVIESFETGIPVVFENFEQYNDLLAQIFKEIDGRAEYHLAYLENKKGFASYNILKRFK